MTSSRINVTEKRGVLCCKKYSVAYRDIFCIDISAVDAMNQYLISRSSKRSEPYLVLGVYDTATRTLVPKMDHLVTEKHNGFFLRTNTGEAGLTFLTELSFLSLHVELLCPRIVSAGF